MKEVPVWEKVALTVEEAAAYSNIGINRINFLLNQPGCPFRIQVGGRKRLIRRKDFEHFLECADEI